jgi:aminoglycoside 3-N-acetyltransferase
MSRQGLPVVRKSQIVHDLRALGLQPGQIVMLHASVKAIGWIVGGPDVVLDALLEVLTPAGTLMMMVGWEDAPYHLPEWDEARQQAYLAECPPFDVRSSRSSHRSLSILAEYIRTRTSAVRSDHPEKSMVAIGAKAEWLTSLHPLDDGFGPGTPLERLVEAGGKVLLLGSPLNNTTLLHYAEYLARVPNKRRVHYQLPVLRDGWRQWVWIDEFDSSNGIRPYGGDYFEDIMKQYIATEPGRCGTVGAAISYLFDAGDLVESAARWMERTFDGEP